MKYGDDWHSRSEYGTTFGQERKNQTVKLVSAGGGGLIVIIIIIRLLMMLGSSAIETQSQPTEYAPSGGTGGSGSQTIDLSFPGGPIDFSVRYTSRSGKGFKVYLKSKDGKSINVAQGPASIETTQTVTIPHSAHYDLVVECDRTDSWYITWKKQE